MRNIRTHVLVAIAVFALGWSPPAFAYLDPGTASFLLQGIIGAFAAAGAVLGLYLNRVKAFFISLRSKVGKGKSS